MSDDAPTVLSSVTTCDLTHGIVLGHITQFLVMYLREPQMTWSLQGLLPCYISLLGGQRWIIMLARPYFCYGMHCVIALEQ